ncbi:MAG: sugar ABC transporter permease, partial [Pseudonocardia sp.]|nr:sugar ABC transporter permease [Pseudonocardia sp.]
MVATAPRTGTGPSVPSEGRRTGVLSGGSPRLAALFMAPAVLLLITFLVYPTGYSIVRSLFDARGEEFVGLGNYATAFTDGRTLVALRNNVIWVVVAPTLVTAIGLVLAVLTERIRWAAAFRLVMFMPLAISLVASGIIFRLVFDEDPQRGVANAVVVAVHDTFASPSPYPGARARDAAQLADQDGALVLNGVVGADAAVALAMTGYPPDA